MVDPISTLYTLLREPLATPDPTGERLLMRPGENLLLHMDNLHAMQILPERSLDFVYIDPPFASNGTYYQQIRLHDHTISRVAYEDVWEHGIASYLEFLVPRLRAIRPLLTPTGSICVHVGHHANHWVKIALDAIYGADHLINEIICRYGKMSNTHRRLPQNHDTLLVYATSANWYFQSVSGPESEYRTRYARDLTGNQVLFGTVKHRKDKLLTRRMASRSRELGRALRDDDVLFDFDHERKLQDDVFTDIAIVRGNAREAVGFDTQKPRKLLERLITAYCPPNGVVADFFCGSGTTGVAAGALDRTWIMVDTNPAAIQTTRERLGDSSYRFICDPTAGCETFEVQEDGSIADFRLDDLELTPRDKRYVESILDRDPETLLARNDDGSIHDIFGRTATVTKEIC